MHIFSGAVNAFLLHEDSGAIAFLVELAHKYVPPTWFCRQQISLAHQFTNSPLRVLT